MTLNDFAPPVFGKILRKIIKEKKVVVYKDYEEAFKNCKTTNAYENSDLCQMIGEKTINYRNYLKERPCKIKPSSFFLASSIYGHLLSNSSSKITVLDFGGACGTHYFETRPLFDERIKFDWNVVETTGMVNSAKNHGLESEELHFFDNIENVVKKVDLLHSSGALQYVPNWSLFLEKLACVNAERMLFTRMMFSENDRTFIMIQKSRMQDSGPGKMPEKYVDRIIECPHTTISFKDFLERLEKSYSLEWIFEDNSGSYKIDNEKIIGRGLLFYKKPGQQ